LLNDGLLWSSANAFNLTGKFDVAEVLDEVSPETLVNVAGATVAVTFVSVDVLKVDAGIHRYIPPSAKIPLEGQ
jgi:hypothetical protein